MKILSIDKQPAFSVAYHTAPKKHQPARLGSKTDQVDFHVFHGWVDQLPEGLEALLVASDLQGRLRHGGIWRLLGELFPSYALQHIELELGLRGKDVGVFLCGDLFAGLDKRGGGGDVREVWEAFEACFKWVTGVAGNHDSFGTLDEFEAFKAQKNIHYLHLEDMELEGWQIAGISGIMGRKKKLQRVDPDSFLKGIERLVKLKPDFCLLHQGPNVPSQKRIGSPEVREILEKCPSTLVCCGHCHWPSPLAELDNGTQVLNVDGRAVILRALDKKL